LRKLFLKRKSFFCDFKVGREVYPDDMKWISGTPSQPLVGRSGYKNSLKKELFHITKLFQSFALWKSSSVRFDSQISPAETHKTM
jgi:hypothetical protein